MIEELIEEDFHKVKHLFKERPFIEGKYEKTIESAKKGRELAIERKEDEWIEKANKLLIEIKER